MALLAWLAAPAWAAPPERPAAQLRIEFEAERAVAGAGVGVLVTARDASGRLTDADVRLDADLGEVGPVVRRTEGRYRATLRVPGVLRAERSVFVLARAGAVAASATVPLAAAPLASISVQAPAVLAADGSTTSQLVVTMLDAFGNPAEEIPAAQARFAELGPAARVGRGYWAFDYRPRWLPRDGEDTVRVRAGAVTGARTVKLVSPAKPFGLAPKSGVVLGSGEVLPMIGAEASAWTSLGERQVGIVVEGSWWRSRRDSSIQAPASVIGFRGERSYLPVTASLAWRQPLGSLASIWLSLGGGMARASSSVSLTGQPTVSGSSWVPVGTAAVSVGLRAWMGYPFAEVRAAWIGDPHLATVSGSSVPILLQLGYLFDAG